MITYNALIIAYKKGPLSQRGLEIFLTMLHQGLPPDVIFYNTLISACEKDTLPQRALQPLEAMLHQGLLPDVIAYLRWSMTAESVRCRRGPCSSWMQWRTEASCPTGSPTSSMIRACEKGTLPRRVHELFKTMLHQGLNPDVITYNALIGACERRYAAAAGLAALGGDDASRPPTRCGHLQRFDQCLRKGHAAAESHAALGVNLWRRCCTKASCQM